MGIYICRDELAYFCELIHVDEMTGDLCLEAYLHQTGTWHLFSQWDEYTNGYITGKISVYNPDMEYSGCRVQRRGIDITIDVYVNFINDLDGFSLTDMFRNRGHIESEITWEESVELIKKGIKLWEGWYGKTPYDKFGLDECVQVQVNLHEKDAGESFSERQEFVDIRVEKIGRSFALTYMDIGGFHLPIGGDWRINRVGHIHLFLIMVYDDETIKAKSNSSFQRTAAHEFGHVFGLGDAYSEPGVRDTGKGNDEVSKTDLMNEGAWITSNDIEMLLLAWKENDRQFFVKERGHEKSKAIVL